MIAFLLCLHFPPVFADDDHYEHESFPTYLHRLEMVDDNLEKHKTDELDEVQRQLYRALNGRDPLL